MFLLIYIFFMLKFVFYGVEVFEEIFGCIEIFEGDDGECELVIVNQVICIFFDVIQVFFDVGFIQEVNSFVLM